MAGRSMQICRFRWWYRHCRWDWVREGLLEAVEFHLAQLPVEFAVRSGQQFAGVHVSVVERIETLVGLFFVAIPEYLLLVVFVVEGVVVEGLFRSHSNDNIHYLSITAITCDSLVGMLTGFYSWIMGIVYEGWYDGWNNIQFLFYNQEHGPILSTNP